MSERVYWDACVFLALLKADPERIETCRALADKAAAGELTIVTSSVTLIEVITLGEKLSVLTRESEQTIRSFFLNSWIEVAQLDRRTAELARELIWAKNLTKYDATHVATSLVERVEVFETYDLKLLTRTSKRVEHDGFVVKMREPYLAQVPMLRPVDA